MLESKIQNKIINKLKAEGYLVIKIIRANVSGVPDILAMKDSKVCFIEVKQKKGKLSELQKMMIEQIKNKGIEVLIWEDYNMNFNG